MFCISLAFKIPDRHLKTFLYGFLNPYFNRDQVYTLRKLQYLILFIYDVYQKLKALSINMSEVTHKVKVAGRWVDKQVDV